MKKTKQIIAGLFIVMSLLISTACGTSSNNTAPTDTTTVSPANSDSGAEKENTVEHRVVETLKGDINVPVDARKVIGTSLSYPEFLYALGVIPIAAENNHEEFPTYYHNSFKDVLKLGNGDTPNLEAMLSVEPDLIIAPAWRDDKIYDQLSKIAPTVLLEYPDSEDWRDELRDIGEALDKKDEAEQVIQDYERKVADAKERLHSLIGEESVIYMRVMPKEIYVLGEQSSRGSIIHKELGLKPVSAFPADEGSVLISLEILPEYNPDHIIIQVDAGEDASQAKSRYEDMLKSSIWKNLNAVKENKVYIVGDKEWFNFGWSPVANSYAIDEIVSVFEKNNP